jgi:hypothetical protein
MDYPKGTTSPQPAIDAVKLAKKHRISIEDAAAILEVHGDNVKAADKAARRIAA